MDGAYRDRRRAKILAALVAFGAASSCGERRDPEARFDLSQE
jgi:hypothetical protein